MTRASIHPHSIPPATSSAPNTIAPPAQKSNRRTAVLAQLASLLLLLSFLACSGCGSSPSQGPASSSDADQFDFLSDTFDQNYSDDSVYKDIDWNALKNTCTAPRPSRPPLSSNSCRSSGRCSPISTTCTFTSLTPMAIESPPSLPRTSSTSTPPSGPNTCRTRARSSSRALTSPMTEANETVVTPVAPKGDARARIIDALIQLAAERKFEEISIRDIALRAYVTLGEFRDAFSSKGAVLGAFNRRIDRAVLDQNYDDMASETPREKLFDVLMRRLEAMAPYRDGLREIVAGLKRDPLAAAQVNRLVLNSMRFMLEAAGIANAGPGSALKLQGLALSWARIVGVWLEDDDPGFAHTMAALDRELMRGERAVRAVDWLDSMVEPVRRLAIDALEAGARIRQRRRARPDAEDKRKA